MADINANTGMLIQGSGLTTDVDPSGNVQPFSHLQRLGDKLFGAVITGVENAIDEALNPADMAQPMEGTQTFLPQSLASYVQRNLAIIAIGALVLLGVMLFSVRR